MLLVVLVIGNHPRGRELALQNLRWGLQVPHRIRVLTLERYGFASLFGETYLTVPEEDRTSNFYHFHERFLGALVEEPDVTHVLLIQQDVLFHGQLQELRPEITFLGPTIGGFFAVYDSTGRLTSPRLWDGGLVIPVDFLRDASRAGVTLGYGYTWALRPENQEKLGQMHYVQWYIDPQLRPIPVRDWITTPPGRSHRGDNFSDLTLYAADRGIATSEIDLTVHITGPEYCHEHLPDIYANLRLLLEVGRGAYDRPEMHTSANIAVMYLLAGVMQPGHLAAHVIRSQVEYRRRELLGFTGKLLIHSHEWMLPAQQGALEWAYGLLAGSLG